MELRPIAHIHTPYGEKFGVPRQSGIAQVRAQVVFVPEFRSCEAVRGLEGFSRLWLLWQFHCNDGRWSPTVRPPRLGGNARLGVFATRSPFRPNPIGLSCVELEGIDLHCANGPVLHLRGADLVDGTPIFDIKPYVPYCDAFPDAAAGFTDLQAMAPLAVELPEVLAQKLSVEDAAALREVLMADPRPRYHEDEQREYGLSFAGRNIRFRVVGGTAVVTAVE